MKYVSSCKSPMSMFGAVAKKYYKEKLGEEKEIVSVAVMPCTSKKMEAFLETSLSLGDTCLSSGGCSRDRKEQCNVLMRAQLQELDCLYLYSGSVT